VIIFGLLNATGVSMSGRANWNHSFVCLRGIIDDREHLFKIRRCAFADHDISFWPAPGVSGADFGLPVSTQISRRLRHTDVHFSDKCSCDVQLSQSIL
jgi:hypothetical protein